MHNQSSPHGTASHGQEHSCYQHYLLQRELAQCQIASLQQLYRQQRVGSFGKSAEAARRATLTTFRTALGDRGRQCIGQRLCPDLAFLG